MRVLVTGAKGFIAGYLIAELLQHGYEVIGLDNLSKYGPVARSFDTHPRYRFVEGDAKDVNLLIQLLHGCDHFVAGAAMIGGIRLIHELPYDLLAENERLTAAHFDAAIAQRGKQLKKITWLSSSMVYESAELFPTPEGEELRRPPPKTSYGMQKLVGEYFARAAQQQYGLTYTIIRPFNCVGIGEHPERITSAATSEQQAIAKSHVIPDLVAKLLAGADPLPILGNGQQIRHYTYGADIATGIRLSLTSPNADNEDFNIATAEGITVEALARLLWQKIRPGQEPNLRFVPGYPFDVQYRAPDVQKAKRLLGFEAKYKLADVLDEVIDWLRRNR